MPSAPAKWLFFVYRAPNFAGISKTSISTELTVVGMVMTIVPSPIAVAIVSWTVGTIAVAFPVMLMWLAFSCKSKSQCKGSEKPNFGWLFFLYFKIIHFNFFGIILISKNINLCPFGSLFKRSIINEHAGRLHRNYENKQEVLIYDYVDFRVPMLERMYQKRLSGYAAIGYAIRGDKTTPVTENRIFSQEEYWNTFSADISNAQKEIHVTSPYLYIASVKRFLKLLPKDVHLTIVTGDESSFKPEIWEKMLNVVKLLEDAGVAVIRQPKVYQRYAVIDKNILWYGGINFLAFEKATHGAMRLCSAELATELLNRSKISNDMQKKVTEV